MNDRLAILVCDVLKREVEQVIAEEGFDDVAVVPVPVRCRVPGASPEILKGFIQECREKFSDVEPLHVLCEASRGAGACGNGNWKEGSGSPCFDLLLNSALIQSHLDRGAYLVTPGWLQDWRSRLAEMGFDQATARNFFGECISRLVLMDTGIDGLSGAHLKALAGYVGLPSEIVPVGLDYLRGKLRASVLAWRIRCMQKGRGDPLVAEYAMALDVLSRISGLRQEQQVIEYILEFFTALCAPGYLVYVPFRSGKAGVAVIRSQDDSKSVETEVAEWQATIRGNGAVGQEFPDGFTLILNGRNGRAGMLRVGRIALPWRKKQYSNLAVAIRDVLALSIEDARNVELLEKIKFALDEGQRISRMGSWDYDLAEEEAVWTDELYWIYGRDRRLGVPSWAEQRLLVHPEDWTALDAAVQRALKDGIPYSLEYRIVRPGGEVAWAWTEGIPKTNEQGRVVRLSGVVQDITERKRSEERQNQMEENARQQQRFALIGTLIGGLSHEINNPIQGIMNYAQLLQCMEDVQGQSKEFAAEIEQESERVASIVRNLQRFARQQTPRRSVNQIMEIIGGVLPLLEPTLRSCRAKARVEADEDLPEIECEVQQIQQVLVNLLTNACEAFKEKDPSPVEERFVVVSVRKTERQSRPWLRITVEDCGVGIGKDVAGRVFDPFFTTKSRSRHSGLGLSVSHAIVRDHNGFLTFESEPGQHTRFHMDLPALSPEM